MAQEDLNENGFLDSRFLNKSYQEAMLLTQDVAQFLEADNAQMRQHTVSEGDEIFYASESMRVSTCLMQVMSWFLVQKGVASGEISREEAQQPNMRLGGRKVCLLQVDPSKGNLPERFVFFMNKSQDLYRQVARMDQMVYGDEDSESSNPVHQLHERLQKTDPSE